MGNPLPEISYQPFQERLRGVLYGTSSWIEERSDREIHGIAKRLHGHYEEVRRWNPRLSLIGPGTAGEVVERHYGEALAALPLLGSKPGQTLMDLGSGAGFPAIVLASVRPDLHVYLVESRERKWAFLKSVVRRCGLSCRCLNARVEASLPTGLPDRIDLVTSRAVALPRSFFELVIAHSPGVRFLLWYGEAPLDLPPGARVDRTIDLAGSRHRRILEVRTEQSV